MKLTNQARDQSDLSLKLSLTLLLVITATSCQVEQNIVPAQSNETLQPPKTLTVNKNCLIPPLPNNQQLERSHTTLPNPFMDAQGNSITDKKQWPCVQQKVKAQAEQYMLGELPPVKAAVTATYQENMISVYVTANDKTIQFDAQVFLPAHAVAPYPAMIGIGRVSLNNEALLQQGVAIINFPNNDIAEQINSHSRGNGKFYQLFGSDHSAGALIAWSWGVSRLIDALNLLPDSPIDNHKLAITGCSRNGKGALIAGAFDSRITLTIPQESGAGGSANWRISDEQYSKGLNVQTLRQIVTENVWFTQGFADFSESVARLPFDQHQIMGLVAPRGLLIIDNAIDWLGTQSSYQNALAAQTIWQALGEADNFAMSQTLPHAHCQQPESQQVAINAFVQKFLFNHNAANTRVQFNENSISEDMSKWIPWSTPTLK